MKLSPFDLRFMQVGCTEPLCAIITLTDKILWSSQNQSKFTEINVAFSQNFIYFVHFMERAYYYYYYYGCLLSQAFLPGISLEPAVIPTAQASSFTLQYFPYCV